MTFARSLGFAALAGAGVPLVVGGLAPWLGHAPALHLYAVACGIAYAAAMAPSLRRAVATALCGAAVGLLLLLLPLRLPTLVLGVALAIALARSVFLHRVGRARAVVLESVLQGAGLLLAAWLARGDLISLALATWAYFLVHGMALRPPEGWGRQRAVDPFDEARSRLLALLD